MKVRKKILSIILTIIMIMCTGMVSFSSLAVNVAEGDCGDTAKYSIDDKGNLVVFGNGKISKKPSIPYGTKVTSLEIKNGITSIASDVFYEFNDITVVTLPDSLDTIGEHAFANCGNLEKINLDKVTRIEKSAFANCSKLEDIGLLNSVTILPDAFYNCGFKEVNINNSVNFNYFVSGQNGTFSKCLNLEKVIINTENIPYKAFGECPKLASINFGEEVKSIGGSAFWKSGLISVKIPSNITTVGVGAFSNCYELKEADLSEAGIEILPLNCFYGDSKLEKVLLPDGLKKIDDCAFASCSKLASITIPASVEEIIPRGSSTHVFNGNYNLQKIVVEEGNPNYYSTAKDGTESNAIIAKSSDSSNDYIVYGCINTIVPTSVDVADYAFQTVKINTLYIKKGINYFGSDRNINVLKSYEDLTDIWYEGTQSDWENVYLSHFNNENINVHYNWDGDVKRTIRFNANSVYAEVNPLKCENISANELIEFPTPEWNGHKCLGWSLYSYVSTPEYYCGQVIKPEINATYYAIWEDDGSSSTMENYTVSFNANGGNVTPSNKIAANGTAITLPTAIKTGFDFLGWSTSSNAIHPNHTAGESFIVTGNISLYAVWRKQESSKITLTDYQKGVQVEFEKDAFDGGINVDSIKLNVEKSKVDDEIDKQLNDYQLTRVLNLDIYNIYLTFNGKEIQPKSAVKVKIAYSGTINDISKVKVFHYYKENGNLMSEKIAPINYVDGYLEFFTNHFSNFIFVIEKKSNIADNFSNITINVPFAKTIDYKTAVTIKAAATGVPSNYYLAIYVNGKQVAKGTNTEVIYKAGQVTSDINYTVKVVDANGNVQKDASGKDIAKDGGKITCNASFFAKIIAFFRGLFGLIKVIDIKP